MSIRFSMALLLVTVAFALALTGCERELPFEPVRNVSITGYQLEGYVTDRLGVPVKNVKVALWYDFSPLSSNTPPSKSLFVNDTSKLVLLRALDIRNRPVKTIFSGKAPLGELEATWDKSDSLGRLVPSGVYTIEFRLGGVVRNAYTVVISGAVSALTDSLGHYVIGNDNLPVDFAPAPLYSSDGTRFAGNYMITAYVTLEFRLDFSRTLSLTLKKNEITRYDLRI